MKFTGRNTIITTQWLDILTSETQATCEEEKILEIAFAAQFLRNFFVGKFY